MLPEKALEIFKKNGYSYRHSSQFIELTNGDKPNPFAIIFLAACVLSIPLALIFLSPAYSLLILFVSLIPAYSLLIKSEVPQTVTLDMRDNSISSISIHGVSGRKISFKDIKAFSITSFEEFTEANALKNSVSTLIYFLTLETVNKDFKLFRFYESDLEEIKVLKSLLHDEIISRKQLS